MTYAPDMDTYTAAAVGGTAVYAASVQGGMQRMMGDLGRMMPSAPKVQAHPYLQARHGMYGHEMSLWGDAKAMIGRGTPETTTMYEYQQMASKDFGERVGGAAAFGALHAGVALGTWHGASKAFGAVKPAYQAGKAFAAARGMGTVGAMATGGLAATGVGLAGIAALTAVDATVGKIVQDVQDRTDVMNFMEASSFRYMQGQGKDIDKRMGAGFNRKARAQIASDIKQIDLGDTRFNMQDLKGVLERGTEMGMFEGTKDAEDFSKKFKDLTQNLKQVTRVLHQSLSEGMKTIKDLKEQGFRGPGAISGAVIQADVLGTASGQTAAEMLSIGRQGAEMVRGTGINMATGSSMMQQTFGMLKSAVASGTLDREMVAQAGGIGQMSQKIMAQSIGMNNSDIGRGYMMAIQRKGGGLDAGRLDDLVSGNMSIRDAVDQGTGNLQTGGDYMDMVNNAGKTRKEIGERYGAMGTVFKSTGIELSMAKELAASQGKSVRESFKFLALQRGESEESVEGRLAMFDNVDEYRKKQKAAFSTQSRKMQMEEYRNRTDVMGRFSDKIDRMVQPASDLVMNIKEGISEKASNMYDGATDWLIEKVTGVKKVEGVSISDKRYAQLFEEGMDDYKDDPERKALEGRTYTKGALKAFEKSDAFKKMNKDFGAKITSGAASLKAGDLDAYSQEVFGKKYSELDKDEIMYMESMSRKMGNDKTLEQIEQKKSEASGKLRDLQGSRMLTKGAQLEDAQERQTETRDDVAEKLSGVAFNTATARERHLFKRALQDPETAGALEEMIIQKGKAVDIDEKIKKIEGSKVRSPESKKAAIAKLQKEKSKIEEGMTDLKVKTSKALGGGENYGSAMNVIEDAISKDPEAFSNAAMELRSAKAGVEGAKGLFESTQFKEGLNENVERMKDIAASSGELDSGQQEDLGEILDDIKDGKKLDTDDVEKFAKLGAASGSSTVGHMSRFAAKVSRRAGAGKLGSAEEVTKFLEGTGTLNMIDKDKREAYVTKNFMGKEGLDTAKLMKFELGLHAGDKEGGVKASGGGVRAGETTDDHAKAATALQDVQTKSYDVLKQLQILHYQLAQKTGAK